MHAIPTLQGTIPHTLTPYRQFIDTNQPSLHSYGLREETPKARGEHAQISAQTSRQTALPPSHGAPSCTRLQGLNGTTIMDSGQI